MRKAMFAWAVLAALALAGCGDKHDAVEPVTCPDGTVLSAEDVEALPGHHGEGFNGTDHCPVAPSVRLEGVPSTLRVFQPGPFSWTLDNGSAHHAHSMLTSIRYGSASVPDSDLTAVTMYPNELIKREHQDLPITYRGNLTFNQVGTVYLRAYMEVGGADHWSPEVTIEVTPVVPTGVVHDITIPPGAGIAGDPTPAESIVQLGDAIRVVNEDLLPRTCTRTSGPAETEPVGDGDGASESIVMVVPGIYEYSCNTVQGTGFRVVVNL